MQFLILNYVTGKQWYNQLFQHDQSYLFWAHNKEEKGSSVTYQLQNATKHMDAVNITFYDSPSFLRPVRDSPYYIDLNQNLYLQAYLHSSDPNLMMFVDTCVASPDPHDFNTLAYDIIKDG